MVLTSATPAAAHAGLHGLSAVLRDSPSLVSVQLASCGLESRHLLPLVAEIQSSPIRLKELDLSGNKIADEGLVELTKIFSVPVMALERFDISGNALEESGISELARALVASDSIQFVQLASHPLPI
jgi:Ran GTPase-activating protein (RanGAP) involved in mRNA processing and transport